MHSIPCLECSDLQVSFALNKAEVVGSIPTAPTNGSRNALLSRTCPVSRARRGAIQSGKYARERYKFTVRRDEGHDRERTAREARKLAERTTENAASTTRTRSCSSDSGWTTRRWIEGPWCPVEQEPYAPGEEGERNRRRW